MISHDVFISIWTKQYDSGAFFNTIILSHIFANVITSLYLTQTSLHIRHQ
jgi:hypothetical protein